MYRYVHGGFNLPNFSEQQDAKQCTLIKVYLFLGVSKGYYKRENTFCEAGRKTYSSSQEATSDCDMSSTCRGLYDEGCYNKMYKLCSSGPSLWSSSQGSCVYTKGSY